MKNMWDDRYGKIEFAYGEQPNNFLKDNLLKFLQVLYYFQQRAKDETQFAATQGWNVNAFDQSIEGKRKRKTSEQT
jgi:hypothetical protein